MEVKVTIGYKLCGSDGGLNQVSKMCLNPVASLAN